MKSNVEPIDPHTPPAWGVRPLFRLRLIEGKQSDLGYRLIDVIAIHPREVRQHDGNVWANEAWSVLVLSRDGKWAPSLVTSDLLETIEDAYEVVQ